MFLCQTPQCTQISHWLENTFFLLLHLIQSSSIRNIWYFFFFFSYAPKPLPCPPPSPPPPYPVPHTHTHTLPFLSLSLQIRAAELYCYFIQADSATGGLAQTGYLVNGALLRAGDTNWSSPIFLIECFNTSYRETAVLQISMFSVTLTNVLLGLCRSPTVSKAFCSYPPSQHKHFNHTQTHTTTHTHLKAMDWPEQCKFCM